MSEPTKAVFLSYASQDAEAVERIAVALRAAGVEVWFDQNELVGGDAWDTKIKRQIQSCALFIPVISTSTEQREEGYFRREWNLAAYRTLDMAHDKAFLLPVVIDQTSDAGAKVPEKFREVQWTRLPGGETTPAFVARVQKLLVGTSNTQPAANHSAPAPKAVAAVPKSGLPSWIAAALCAVVVALVAFVVLRPATKDVSSGAASKPVAESTPTTPAPAPAPALPPVAPDKSIAVLPFTNLSDDKDSGTFADGVQLDILTQLSNLANLRVVSRTSVIEYRGTTKKIPQIARELGVSFLLEGSVRRAGNKVKVTGQLIDARNDSHLWAKEYYRDLTDIFAIQSELAKEITSSLQAVLTPEEKARLERAPTDNLRAYELFLQARALSESTISALGFTAVRQRYDQAVALLEQAVQLDPKFVAAWLLIADLNGQMYFFNINHVPSRLAGAREGIDSAARLAPNDPEVVLAEGQFYFHGFRDWARARTQYERVLARAPGHLRGLYLLAQANNYDGRWVEALATLRKVVAGDPRDWNATKELAETLWLTRRYDEAAVLQRTGIENWPDKFEVAYYYALLPFYAHGSTRELEEFFASRPVPQQTDESVLRWRLETSWVCGNAAEYLHWTQALGGVAKLDELRKTQLGAVLLATGDTEGATELLRATRAGQEKTSARQPENFGLCLRLAESCAYLGDAAAADAALAKAAALRPRDREALEGTATELERAIVFAWTSRKEEAVAELARVLRAPCLVGWGYSANVHHLRVGLEWAPLRDRADFQALLNDPKNNAPLF